MGWIGLVFCVFVMLAMCGCGGGGGGGDDDDDDSSNTSPKAIAAANLSVVNPDDEVSLDGSDSSDSDGEIVDYQWVQTQGTSVSLDDADTAIASFVVPDADEGEALVFQLTVKDDDGSEDANTVTVTVNVRPSADAGEDQFAYDGAVVTLNGTDSDDDGSVESRQWEQVSGTEVVISGETTTSSLSFTTPPASTEELIFSYTVTDDLGTSHSDTVSVFVSQILFSDTFGSGDSLTDNWDTVDDTTIGDSWSVNGGELVQTGYLVSHSNSFSESYHLGSFAYLKEAVFSSSSTFRFSVEITPQSNDDSDEREGNDVGIMFPYSSAGGRNYYRLSMNARYGFTRLEKWDGTEFSTLAVNSIGYIDDETVAMAVEVNGDTIMAFIDGDPVFAASDLAISQGTVALYCQDKASFDNVIIADNSLQPMVVVSTPTAYSLPLVGGAGDALSATAVALNVPNDAGVVFTVDEESETVSSVSGNLYSAQLLLSEGEHEVAAILEDGEGDELNRDTNLVVGAGGDYYLTVGDSITNGVEDDYPNDNISEDGRIIAIQGYQAPLNDLLTSGTGLPQLVVNEGIGADQSSHLLDERIDSILDRHPLANTMLLLIGTNDVQADQPVADFKDNLTQIVDKALDADIDQVYIAFIPPCRNYSEDGDDQVTGAAGKNTLAQMYNAGIEDVVDSYASSAVKLGPDFYTLFVSQMDEMYADGLHPNNTGYQAMSSAWYAILNP